MLPAMVRFKTRHNLMSKENALVSRPLPIAQCACKRTSFEGSPVVLVGADSELIDLGTEKEKAGEEVRCVA